MQRTAVEKGQLEKEPSFLAAIGRAKLARKNLTLTLTWRLVQWNVLAFWYNFRQERRACFIEK